MILLQIDVNAMPISSVDDCRLVISTAKMATAGHGLKPKPGDSLMTNPMNVGPVEVDRKGQAGKTWLTRDQEFGG